MIQLSATDILERLSSAFSSGGRRTVEIAGFHRAAVLVPIILAKGPPEVLLTQRTEDVETHKGQVSFPGGMVDEGDADIVHTALRETEEEVGIPRGDIQTLGMLDDLPTPTGFVITPVVGILTTLPQLTPNPREVAEVFRLPFAFFADPANGRHEMKYFRGAMQEVWYYECGGRIVWGATAMIIRSLLRRIRLI
jgi:8-oxo-dGTP pyrophosphatase MutT (NUDIX family)